MTIERTKPAFAKASAGKPEDPIAAHWSSATPDQVDAARTRVLNRLQFPVEADRSSTDSPPATAVWRWHRAAWVAAAVLVFAAAVFTGRLEPLSQDSELVRSGAQSREITLADGSRVEMRPDSELSLERADDGIGINLRSGSIIVNAAKQHVGTCTSGPGT
jgi:ferric-dicitrate binding protein FerR (iron transport regulator)